MLRDVRSTPRGSVAWSVCVFCAIPLGSAWWTVTPTECSQNLNLRLKPDSRPRFAIPKEMLRSRTASWDLGVRFREARALTGLRPDV